MNLQCFQEMFSRSWNVKFSNGNTCFFKMQKLTKMRCTEQSEIWCFSGHRARKSSIFAMNLQRFQKAIPGMQNTKFSYRFSCFFGRRKRTKIRYTEQSEIWCFSGHRTRKSSIFAMNLQRFQKVIPGMQNTKFSLGNTWLFEKQNVPKIRSLEQSRIWWFSGHWAASQGSGPPARSSGPQVYAPLCNSNIHL